MDIWVTDEGFAIGMLNLFEYKSNKDGTLSVWTKKGKGHVSITTNRGTFIEAFDKTGNVLMAGGDGEWCYVPISKQPINLRKKELPKIELSKSELGKQRKVVTRYLLSNAPYSLNIPDTLPGAMKWMEKQLKSIPAKSRTKAIISFDTSMEYGETYPNIEITYREPETDDEVILRLQIEAERAQVAEDKERNQFRKLKSKFCAN